MNSTWKAIAGISTIAGPLGFVLGWAILIQRAGQGPDSGWFLSHAFLLSGVALMFPTIAGLRHLLNHHAVKLADMGMGLALLGALALVGQFAIDLAVGQLSANQSEMSSLFKRLSATPIIALPFQIVGPIAFYIGLLILTFLLLRFRVISWWTGPLAALGIIGVGGGAMTGNALVTLLGFIGICVGFVPIGWKLLNQPGTGQR
ncbi:MAG: hypothetical protein ACXW4Q_16690 [Anaerolineales bacterium]